MPLHAHVNRPYKFQELCRLPAAICSVLLHADSNTTDSSLMSCNKRFPMISMSVNLQEMMSLSPTPFQELDVAARGEHRI